MKAKYNSTTNTLQEMDLIGQSPTGVFTWIERRKLSCSLECRSVFKDGQVYEERKDYVVKNNAIPLSDQGPGCSNYKIDIVATAYPIAFYCAKKYNVGYVCPDGQCEICRKVQLADLSFLPKRSENQKELWTQVLKVVSEHIYFVPQCEGHYLFHGLMDELQSRFVIIPKE